MRELKPTQSFNWDNEVDVQIKLSELAVIYSILAKASTWDIQKQINCNFSQLLDVINDDLPYLIYKNIQSIIESNGVKLKG